MKKQTFENTVIDLTQKIMGLSVKVNQENENVNVFVRYYGHVQSLDVDIEEKGLEDKRIEFDTYLNEESYRTAEEIITKLKKIIRELKKYSKGV